MSKSAFRKQIAAKLIENYNRKSEKTVGDAARILLQSADVRQCLVIKNRETKNDEFLSTNRPYLRVFSSFFSISSSSLFSFRPMKSFGALLGFH